MVDTATGAVTDVGGILVGHHHRLDADAALGSGWATGTTVILTPPGTVGAVDVRGGAPGTRETDLLDPANSVRYVDAVVLTGGSAYGLAAADGVMRWLEEHGRGVVMDGGAGEELVPIVPAAVIFDLPVGAWTSGRPPNSVTPQPKTPAPVSRQEQSGRGWALARGVLKGGVGTASVVLDSGVTVGALVVVNSFGDVVDPATGLPWMNFLAAELDLNPPPPAQVAAFAALVAEAAQREALNTGVAVVATDAALSP